MGAASLVTLGTAALSSTAAAAEVAADPRKPKDIRTGMLTAPLRDRPFDAVLDLAKACHISAMEVVAEPRHPHIDPATLTEAQADAIKQKLSDRGLEISALSNYMNCAGGNPSEVQEMMKKTINAAAMLGVPTICCILGMPVRRKSKIQTIKEVIPGLFRPFMDHAKEKGIQVAVENWYATCLQGMDTFDCLMETIPD